MSRNTIRKYWRWEVFQAKTIHHWSPVLRYEAYLRKRWEEGQRHVKTLHKELQAQGYQGRFCSLYQVISQWLGEEKSTRPPARRVDYSPRQVSSWLARPIDKFGVVQFSGTLRACLKIS